MSICILNFFGFFSISMSLFLLSIYFLLFDLVYFIEWELLSIHSCLIVMTFLFDWMSLMFMSFVLFISSLVIFYSKDYMGADIHINRFIFLVFMFVFSMMMMIISPNLISILLGWDGLGLVSYCLVIYYQNVKSFNAGMLTALSNRIGDVALLLAIAWMLNYGGWNFIFYIEMMKMDYEMKMIGALVVLAAMTKSAQIPFSSWLPAAMAAPTPVSALVHSSTLVTAGVYLLIRFNILFFDSWLGQTLLLISGLTMFMAGMSANFEFDLKKIIALSTLSQLGLMMSILSMGYPKLAFFHLLTHALFKALLFMCAGAIIHNMKNSQDIRDMGSLITFMPFTTSCFNVANLALCGMPFLAGFYSKDLILEIVSMSPINYLSFFIYFFSTGLTVCYSFRLSYYTLSKSFNQSSLNNLSDESWVMSVSMLGLLVMAVIGGSMLSWLMFSSNYFIVLPFYLKNLTLTVCLLGGFSGYLLSKVSLLFSNKSLNLYLFSFINMSMWFMPLISTLGLVKYPLSLGFYTLKSFDQGWSEFFGGQKIYSSMTYFSALNQILQDNNLKIYFMMFAFWVIFLVMFLVI
nr:NADH dehydrogenase subunit 5 [Limnophyes sp. YF-2022]